MVVVPAVSYGRARRPAQAAAAAGGLPSTTTNNPLLEELMEMGGGLLRGDLVNEAFRGVRTNTNRGQQVEKPPTRRSLGASTTTTTTATASTTSTDGERN